MRHVILTLAALALVALAALAGAAMAQPGPGRAPRAHLGAGMAGGPDRGAQLEKLHLTDDQKARLRDARFAAGHKRIESRAKLAEAMLQLRQLMTAEKLDEAAIHAQAMVVGDLQGQAAQNRIEDRLAMLSVLTPEQRQTAHQMAPGRQIIRRRIIRGLGGPGMPGGRTGMLDPSDEGGDGDAVAWLDDDLDGPDGLEGMDGSSNVRIIRIMHGGGSDDSADLENDEDGAIDEAGPNAHVRVIRIKRGAGDHDSARMDAESEDEDDAAPAPKVRVMRFKRGAHGKQPIRVEVEADGGADEGAPH